MSNSSNAAIIDVNSIDERVRDVEKQISRLATEMSHLAETAASSQLQMADQAKIQTEILITMRQHATENTSIAEHIALLSEDMADVKSYVDQERGAQTIKKYMWGLAATIFTGVTVSLLAYFFIEGK
jgi:TolA-binding protein